MKAVFLGLIWVGSWAMAVTGSLLAHDPGISTAQGELKGGVLLLTTGFAPADVEYLLSADLPRADRWALGEFETVRGSLKALVPSLWEVMADGARIAPAEINVELLPGDNVSFSARFALGSNDRTVSLGAALLPRLPAGHRQFVVISDTSGSTIVKKLLSASDFALELPRRAPGSGTLRGGGGDMNPNTSSSNGAMTFLGFLRLGIEHIWTGYDHLLFLLALLIVCRSYRSTLAIVTCFTLAHSLTLALATFNLVSIPSRWVEAAIAGSIVFVGVENLIRGGREPKGRWAITFGFGLIHGFGFASVLRDLGVGATSNGVAVPLFAFNLGVEVGQIVVAAIALPILWKLRTHGKFSSIGIPVVSGVVTIAGLLWLAQRTFFS